MLIPMLDAGSAGAVSTHVPIATAKGSFVFGHQAVPTATRRVVNTSQVTAWPLALLFWVARGDVPGPSLAPEPLAAPSVATPATPATPAAPVAAPASAPTQSVAPPWNGVLPPLGHATAWGCPAAIQYLSAYAAPGFSVVCPGNAWGHQATTICVSTTSPCNVERAIVISEPCPAAYMNETSNSWMLIGVWDVSLDPYGQCS
ncbi:MAG TPA: hypothetical protein VGG38_07080 [Acidimicrobiales bacterium]